MDNFCFYFLDGSFEECEANSVSDAFSSLGYGAGAIHALSFYSTGIKEYNWNSLDREWEKE